MLRRRSGKKKLKIRPLLIMKEKNTIKQVFKFFFIMCCRNAAIKQGRIQTKNNSVQTLWAPEKCHRESISF